MISGHKDRRVSAYLCIDHLAEGFGWTKPEDGEDFVGIPYGSYTDNSEPFIEVRVNGFVRRTINVRDLSMIDFVEEVSEPTERKTNEPTIQEGKDPAATG